MRIDAHLHFSPEYTPLLLAPILKRNRFEGAVVVCSRDDTDRHLELATSHALILGIVAWADLTDRQLGHTLDEYQRHPKFRGVTTSWNGELPAGLSELSRRGLTLDLQDLSWIPRIADQFPELRMVIDHLGRPPGVSEDAFRSELERAASYPRVFGKLSGLITSVPGCWKADDFRPYVQRALRVFGPQRLMFGSDWPSYLPEGTFKEALAAFTQSVGPLPLAAREHLLGGTASQFYRIAQGAAADAI